MLGNSLSFFNGRVVKNVSIGKASIGAHPALSLRTYAKISSNPLVKMFRLFALIYSFPLTIIGAVSLAIATKYYIHGVIYLVGLFLLIAVEAYVSQTVTINHALKSEDTFSKLYAKGIIKIIPNSKP